MAKVLVIAFIQILSLLLLASLGRSDSANLVFYEHGWLNGSSQSVFPVAGLPTNDSTDWGVDQFGTVLVVDNVLTTGVETSTKVGHVLGMLSVASVSHGYPERWISQSLCFHGGEYKGSTIEIKGVSTNNEGAVVGGTGLFRYATGYITSERVYEDAGYFIYKLSVAITLPAENLAIALK